MSTGQGEHDPLALFFWTHECQQISKGLGDGHEPTLLPPTTLREPFRLNERCPFPRIPAATSVSRVRREIHTFPKFRPLSRQKKIDKLQALIIQDSSRRHGERRLPYGVRGMVSASSKRSFFDRGATSPLRRDTSNTEHVPAHPHGGPHGLRSCTPIQHRETHRE